jgi:hypothetical protein
LPPIPFHCIFHQPVCQVFRDGGNVEVGYSTHRIRPVEEGIIGEVEEDCLHLSPDHSFNGISGLGERRPGSGKVEAADAEAFGDPVQGPLMCRGIRVGEVEDFVVILLILYDADDCLSHIIHGNNICCGVRIRGDVNPQAESLLFRHFAHEAIEKMGCLNQDIPSAERSAASCFRVAYDDGRSEERCLIHPDLFRFPFAFLVHIDEIAPGMVYLHDSFAFDHSADIGCTDQMALHGPALDEFVQDLGTSKVCLQRLTKFVHVKPRGCGAVEQGVHIIQPRILFAPLFPLFISIEDFAFEPVQTVGASRKPHAPQEPDRVELARLIAVHGPDAMVTVEQFGHEVLTEEPGASGEKNFHRFCHCPSSLWRIVEPNSTTHSTVSLQPVLKDRHPIDSTAN